MDYKRILVAALFVMFISLIIHTAGSFLDMDYYTNSENFSLWSNIMMPDIGPPGIEFYGLSLVFGLITGLIFTIFYILIAKTIRQKTVLKTGLFYGILLFILTQIPMIFSMFLLFAIPIGLLLSWVLQSLIIAMISGVGIVYIVRYTCKFNDVGSLG